MGAGNTQQGQQDSGGEFESVYPFVEVQFTDTSSGADSVLWNFGDGNTSTERNPKHKFYDNGNYNVTLTVINSAGEAVSQESVQITGVSDDTGEEEVTNETEVIYGCTNPTATNYNPNATQDDGSCQYNSEQETTSTEPRPTNPPSGYNPMFGNFRIGAVSSEGQWTWNGYAWILNSSTTTVTTTESDDTSGDDIPGDDSDTGGGRPEFNYQLEGQLNNRTEVVNSTRFNIVVNSINYPELIREIENYVNVPNAIYANGQNRTIIKFETDGEGGRITLAGNVGSGGNPTTAYNFNMNISSIIDLSGNGGNGDGDVGGGYDGPPK